MKQENENVKIKQKIGGGGETKNPISIIFCTAKILNRAKKFLNERALKLETGEKGKMRNEKRVNIRKEIKPERE